MAARRADEASSHLQVDDASLMALLVAGVRGDIGGGEQTAHLDMSRWNRRGMYAERLTLASSSIVIANFSFSATS